MKKLLSLFVALLVLLSVNPVAAKRVRPFRFRTYEVVQMTGNIIVLQAKTGEKVEIEKSLRPELKTGDWVRFDKNLNKLGATIPAGTTDELEDKEE